VSEEYGSIEAYMKNESKGSKAIPDEEISMREIGDD
jgi:hypothetical protein